MSLSRFVTFLFCAVTITTGSLAQSTVPALKSGVTFTARTLVAGEAPISIHLSDYFEVPTVTGTVVQFDTIRGKFNAELLSADAPKTVTNFLNYTLRGAYNNSLVHRSVPGFVIQGGGYWLNSSTITPITTDPAIQNEFKLSNVRGTIAMAKTPQGPDTATSQWFINLADNHASLDSTNGGYTVFGRVLGTGMTVADSIASIPVYDASGQLGASFNEMPLTGSTLVASNLVMVHSVQAVPVYPNLADSGAVLTFSALSANTGIVTAEVVGSTLTLRPVAAGSTTVTVAATDTNGNQAPGQTSFPVTVTTTPVFTTQPASRSIDAGSSATISVAATSGATLQWYRNGGGLSGATTSSVSIPAMEPALAGLYTVVATSGNAATRTTPAIVGLQLTDAKLTGTAEEVGSNIPHPNGNIFDQVLLEKSTTTGISAASVRADYALNQITRTSFIDLNDDIVQVEYAGPGTLSILMDSPTGPAVPTKYNQTTQYIRGHASIVIVGATENSHVSVFTVGKATAYDPTGAYDISKPISATNNPANNGNPIFKAGTSYDGVAGIARISIRSVDGKFGSIRTANTLYYDVKGYTGIYAPGVTVVGAVYVGDISAYTGATPALILGGSPAESTLITGGDLRQDNGQPIQISGITRLKFQAGTDSHGNTLPAQKNQGILHQNGVNVTAQVVVNPQ